MKHLLIIVAVGLMITKAGGEIVKLAWDKSATEGVSYTLTIAPTNAAAYKVNVGTNLTTTLNLTNRTVINVRALKDGTESDPSNDVVWQPTPTKPSTPANLRIIIEVKVEQL